jgi:heptaprenyl diphosphate synthase/octaprenyl-diphosphate synthase
LDLKEIYAPVEKDLMEVEARLRATSNVEFPHLSQLVAHCFKGGGKRIRPCLALLSGKLFDYDLERLIPMATALEILHTATLVHDDAIDHSPVRRGLPTVNKLWGEEQAVLLGDYLFAEAGRLTASTGSIRATELFARTLKTISSGEIDQAFNAFTLNQTREQYYQRIARKTASLFTASTESGAILSNATEQSVQLLIDYGYNLGIGFQIVDDILDFIGDEEQMGKPTGSDLTQGTVTLPVFLLVQYYPEERAVKDLFKDRRDDENIKTVISLVRNSPGIIDECYAEAAHYCEKAYRILADLPDSPARRSLQELCRYIVRRKK